MRCIIAGSREATELQVFLAILRCQWSSEITTVLSGCCRGADKAGELWAEHQDLPIVRYPAQWNKYGRSAGHMRNRQMAQNADALILVWSGSSNGSRNMLEEARAHKLRIFEHRTDI